eukprot:403331528
MNSGSFVGGSLKLKGANSLAKLQKSIVKSKDKKSSNHDKSDKKHKKDKKKSKHSKKHKKDKKKHKKRSDSSDSSSSGYSSRYSDNKKDSGFTENQVLQEELQRNGIPQNPLTAQDDIQEQKPYQLNTGSHFLTESERRYQEVQRQRQMQRIQDKVHKNHREKIEDFNKKLAKLPEHFDIPKVGPG